jgi:multiple sugar transport system substrate-binding protein
VESVDINAGTSTSGPISRRSILKGVVGAAAAIPAVSLLTGGAASAAARAGREATWSFLRHPRSETAELQLVYFGSADAAGTWEALIAEFNKTNPGVEITANAVSGANWGEYITTVATQLAGGAEYDIVYAATESQLLLASRDLLLPLDDYMAADQEAMDDYFADVDPNLKEWTVTYGSPDGRTYFLPGGYNTMVLYCNTAVFEEAGVTLPETDWTWDEFYEAGVKIKESSGAFLHPFGSGFVFGNIMPWLLTTGASTLDAEWTTATFNTPEAVAAAEFAKKCIDDELSPVPGGAFDLGAQFADGALATFGGGRWMTPMIRDLELVEQTRILNFPTNAGNGSPIGWDAWPIMKSSKNPDAAWTFLRWLTTVDAGVYYAEVGGTNIPARNSIANSESFLANAPVGSELMSAAVAFATPIPSPDDLPGAEAAIADGWTAAITGQQPAQEALDEANEALQAVL